MADIILLDKYGNPNTYKGVTEIKVAKTDGTSQKFEEAYRMASAYFYFVRPSGDGWEVTYRSKGLSSGNTGIVGGFAYADCERYGYQDSAGNWAVGVLVSKNANLTVGSVYSSNELLNG